MSDLGIICALFGYLLRSGDAADMMVSGYNIVPPLRALLPSLFISGCLCF